jgi:hypothetical protein
MGYWQRTIIEDGKAIADAATSVTVNVPRANFIGSVGFTLRGTGGSGTVVMESKIKKIELMANGSSGIINTHPTNGNRQIRDIMQFKRRGVRGDIETNTGGAARVTTNILMGRYKHDRNIILPAFLYSSLYLKLTFDTLIATTGFATGTVKLDVFIDEYVDAEARQDRAYLESLAIQKIEDKEGSIATSASGDNKTEMSLGDQLLAGIYCYASGTDGTTVTKAKVSLNHGQNYPVSETWLFGQDENKIDYQLASGTKISNALMIDFDNPATEQVLGEVLELSRNAGVEKLETVLTMGAGSQTIEVVQINYVPVAALLA